MIDRDARDVAARVLQRFIDGEITNDEYEEAYGESNTDPALCEIWMQMWFCYSDMKTHALTGSHTLSDENRAISDRFILYLRSDLEFEWPRQKIRLRYLLYPLLGLRRRLAERDEEYRRSGDLEVWPFLRRAHYEQALAREVQRDVVSDSALRPLHWFDRHPRITCFWSR